MGFELIDWYELIERKWKNVSETGDAGQVWRRAFGQDQGWRAEGAQYLHELCKFASFSPPKFGGAMFFKEPFLFSSAILLHPAAAASLFFESVVETCSIPTLVISWTPYCYSFTPTNPTCLGVPIAHFQEHDLCSDGRPQRLKSRPSSFFDFPLLRWYGWLKNCWVLQKHSFCLDASTFFQSDAP